MKEIFNKIKYFLIGVLVFLLYFKILPLLLSTIFKNLINMENKIVTNIVLSIAEILIFVVLFLIFRKTIIEDIKKFKNDFKHNFDIGFKYYFTFLLVMITSNIILTAIFGGIAANEEVNRAYLKAYPLYSIVAMIFIGPLVEEIVFRLGFRKAFKNSLTYCIFSALLFGGLHVYTAYDGYSLMQILKNWHELLYIIPYGALGFSFAKTYYETNNICTSMSIHVIHNAFTIFLIFCAT